MKLLNRNLTYQALLALCLGGQSLFVYSHNQQDVSFSVPAYRNAIQAISYAAGSDNQYAITFSLEKRPICIYAPADYEAFTSQRERSYFLPRTKYSDEQMRDFYQEINTTLQPLGIKVVMKKIVDKHYGMQMIFMFEKDASYDIVKVVDIKNKLVHFNLVEKI